MKRDLNLMRNLLIQIEDINDTIIDMQSLLSEDKPRNEVGFNLLLLKQSGFIDADIKTNLDGDYYGMVRHITPSGFDYLDSIRDPKIWRIVTERIQTLGSGTKGVALEVIKALATETIKGILGCSLPL